MLLFSCVGKNFLSRGKLCRFGLINQIFNLKQIEMKKMLLILAVGMLSLQAIAKENVNVKASFGR